MNKYAQKFKQIRELLNISQVELAKVINIHSISISRYERGEVIPSIEVLSTLVKSLSVNPRWFLLDEGEPFGKDKIVSPDKDIQKIIDILTSMSDVKRKEFLNHIEEKKLLADLLNKQKKDHTG